MQRTRRRLAALNRGRQLVARSRDYASAAFGRHRNAGGGNPTAAPLVVAATLAVVGASACGAPDAAPPADAAASSAIVVVDDAGREIRLASPARRVLSLVPARTDVIVALGAADRLIARTRWDEDPRLAQLPSIDNALLPSLEWVAARRPELVVAWPDAQSRAVVARLRELGIGVYASGVETLAETRRSIQDLGALLGLDARADSLLGAIEAMHDSARAAVAGRPRRTVAYVVGLDPPMVAGPGTFSHELVGVAGGDNVFADAEQPWPQVSLEALIRRDPDVLIVTVPPERDVAAELAGRTGWRELTAVRTGRVHVVHPDVLNRPGPSVGAAALILARLIHPDAFVAPADTGLAARAVLRAAPVRERVWAPIVTVSFAVARSR